jgi:hypothetical protein
MKTLYRRCAGLDVHKKEVVACLRLAIRGKAIYEVRRFPTTTRGLLDLADWLEQASCTHVAMEATGVYWKPVWHILEGRFQQVLANATRWRARSASTRRAVTSCRRQGGSNQKPPPRSPGRHGRRRGERRAGYGERHGRYRYGRCRSRGHPPAENDQAQRTEQWPRRYWRLPSYRGKSPHRNLMRRGERCSS